jgi:hypothetical protein
MIFTHVLLGALIGAVYSLLASDYTTVAVFAGILGGGSPDLDMALTHRKSFHYPIISSVIAVIAGVLVVLVPSVWTVFLFFFLLAAAVHSVTDILGGGKEMRPWLEMDERAVYNHITDEWVRPRRIIYDGSISDLAISVITAAVLFYLLPSSFDPLIATILGLGIVYAILRRWITRQISEEFETFSAYIQHWLSALHRRFM